MLKRMEIHNTWNLHCSVYGEGKEKEEPYQMPVTDKIYA